MTAPVIGPPTDLLGATPPVPKPEPGDVPSPAPATGTPVPEPLWFLRVNPLRRARLADAELRRQLVLVTAAEQSLAVASAAASDELYERIGAATDDAERRELIALRRSVNSGKAPKKRLLPPVAP